MTALTSFSLCGLQSNSFIFFPLIPQVRPRGMHNPCQTTSGHLKRKERSSDVGGGFIKLQKPALSCRQLWVSQDPRIVPIGFMSLGVRNMLLVRVIPIGFEHIQMYAIHIPIFKNQFKNSKTKTEKHCYQFLDENYSELVHFTCELSSYILSE